MSFALVHPTVIAGRSQSFLSAVGELWCRAMHDDITWPRHGRYQCRICGREYPVPWEEGESHPSHAATPCGVIDHANAAA
jgi:hypothetical protein